MLVVAVVRVAAHVLSCLALIRVPDQVRVGGVTGRTRWWVARGRELGGPAARNRVARESGRTGRSAVIGAGVSWEPDLVDRAGRV